ncbi:hypothetical protein VNO80_04195 [Phaseolus coccineus]|uniref:Uncharacterized protein n=1 Tax=Phaseolus coccineus TaxID=3886 RepID=A0AAN9NXG7_PHACN
MEIPESDRRKLQQQPPGLPIPTTPFNPIVPMPVPIWTPEMGNQLYSHFNGIPAGFHLSACPDINNWPFHRSEPAAFAHHNAQTAAQISFDAFPSSSNGIAELYAQADTPFAYSNVTNEELLSQFIPPYNLQCNPSYASFDHHQLSLEQPFVSTIHNQYQDLLGSSYFDYCSKTFPQIAPHKDDAVAAEPRKDAAAPTIIKERNHQREEKNAPAKYDPNRETAASSALRKENYNHKMEVSLDFDLNKTPQPKARRRKHRPKVIKEDKPKQATKKVQSKENQTDKKKARKGLNTTSTPQTEVTGGWTTPLTPESATKTCRRSLNFDTREQARDGNSRHKETMLFAKASSSRNWMADYNGLQECAQILSKPVAQSSSNNSNSRDCLSTGCGLQAVGSKRKQPGIEQADNGNINLIGAQYNAMQAYCQDYGVQFPNVQKKRRTENGRISKTPCKSSVTDLKDQDSQIELFMININPLSAPCL